ncbi:hypothetical protein ACFE04_017976 [Oxalis oulophora]
MSKKDSKTCISKANWPDANCNILFEGDIFIVVGVRIDMNKFVPHLPKRDKKVWMRPRLGFASSTKTKLFGAPKNKSYKLSIKEKSAVKTIYAWIPGNKARDLPPPYEYLEDRTRALSCHLNGSFKSFSIPPQWVSCKENASDKGSEFEEQSDVSESNKASNSSKASKQATPSKRTINISKEKSMHREPPAKKICTSAFLKEHAAPLNNSVSPPSDLLIRNNDRHSPIRTKPETLTAATPSFVTDLDQPLLCESYNNHGIDSANGNSLSRHSHSNKNTAGNNMEKYASLSIIAPSETIPLTKDCWAIVPYGCLFFEPCDDRLNGPNKNVSIHTGHDNDSHSPRDDSLAENEMTYDFAISNEDSDYLKFCVEPSSLVTEFGIIHPSEETLLVDASSLGEDTQQYETRKQTLSDQIIILKRDNFIQASELINMCSEITELM